MFALEIFIGLSKKVQHEPFTADTAGDKQLRRQGKDLNHPLKKRKPHNFVTYLNVFGTKIEETLYIISRT